MSNFYVDTIQTDPRFHSTDACNDVALLEPQFRDMVAKFQAAALAQGIELVTTETYRSSERQQQLFDQGKTQLRTVGVHHYGLACDFAKRIDGALSWDGDWTFMARIAESLNSDGDEVISGYDWGEPDQPHSFRDSDHIQGCTVAQQTALFGGSWYPNATQTVGTVAPVPSAVTNPAPISVPDGLTTEQETALTAFDQVNQASYSNWFKRSTAMAFMETESDFNPNAIRHEPSGVTSYGLMQVLDSTAKGLGLNDDPVTMYQPTVGIFYGLKYLAQGWNYLTTHLGRPPTMTEWVAGFNEGYGAAGQGRLDPNYVDVWTANQAKWTHLDAA